MAISFSGFSGTKKRKFIRQKISTDKARKTDLKGLFLGKQNFTRLRQFPFPIAAELQLGKVG